MHVLSTFPCTNDIAIPDEDVKKWCLWNIIMRSVLIPSCGNLAQASVFLTSYEHVCILHTNR